MTALPDQSLQQVKHGGTQTRMPASAVHELGDRMATRIRSIRSLPATIGLAAMAFAAGCHKAVHNLDRSGRRRAWVKTFNVIFDNSISNRDVRWIHAWMAKKGYKRIYNTGRRAKLEAGIGDAACYEKA